MKDFNTQVLRERFVLDPLDDKSPAIITLSNRAVLDLVDSNGKIVEKVVLRGHMLHTVVRLMGSLLNTYTRTGPLFKREPPLKWEEIWDLAAGPFERAHNPELWVAIYHQGKPVYQQGDHPNFVDVLEMCDYRESGNYDRSINTARDMFNRAGHPVTVEHDSNIAASFNINKKQGRVSLVLRGAQKKTTFSFTGEARDLPAKEMNPVHFINAAAAFLDGIHLAFHVGTGNERLRRGLMTTHSTDGILLTAARARIAESNAAVRAFENLHVVHYRPERPEFAELVVASENMTRKRLDEEEAEALEAAEAAATENQTT